MKWPFFIPNFLAANCVLIAKEVYGVVDCIGCFNDDRKETNRLITKIQICIFWYSYLHFVLQSDSISDRIVTEIENHK